MINAIRAEREQPRQSQVAVLDYTSLDGGCNHGTTESLSDEEPELQWRIAMFKGKIEGGKKGFFESFDDRAVDVPLRKEIELEDDEDKIGEEKQFRKGLGKRMDDVTTREVSITVAYGLAPSIGAVGPPPPSIEGAMVAGQALDFMSLLQ
ncbi:hypothetical protein ACJRO7_000710 [Eucalyptus globulus]|uniref:Uncharacterized protein n=1 Tax=Eucalyptus globulus TaxID=34317 RepID=A0ABD3LPH8_EUCGL